MNNTNALETKEYFNAKFVKAIKLPLDEYNKLDEYYSRYKQHDYTLTDFVNKIKYERKMNDLRIKGEWKSFDKHRNDYVKNHMKNILDIRNKELMSKKGNIPVCIIQDVIDWTLNAQYIAHQNASSDDDEFMFDNNNFIFTSKDYIESMRQKWLNKYDNEYFDKHKPSEPRPESVPIPPQSTVGVFYE